MLKNSGSCFFPAFAKILSGTQTDTKIIINALKFICDEVPFSCGIIYEVDISKQFSLTDVYATEPVAFPQFVPLNQFRILEQLQTTQQYWCCVERADYNTQEEIDLLEFYHAQSIVLAPIVEEDWTPYGFIVLLRIPPKDALAAEDMELLPGIISMLTRYVGFHMLKKRMRQNRATFESILDNTGIDIYVNDFYTHEILYVNKSMADPYGGQSVFDGNICWQVLFPGQSGPCSFCPKSKIIDEQGKPSKIHTWDYQRAFDGAWFRVFSAAFYWVDGRLAHVVSSANISDNKQNEALIENMANYDQLTQLPNRRMLLKECQRCIGESTREIPGYLLFFDIDGFKAINDSFGHDAGDEFLIKLAQFFMNIPLLQNTIFRNAGDEFVALIGGESITKANIQSLAHFIHQRFKEPWKLKKGDIYCNTSIGVACYPEDGTTAEELLQKADLAMYRVKKAGGGAICFGYQL